MGHRDQDTLFELPAPARRHRVIKWGGGVDSTTVIWRLLTEPQLRDFPIEDMTVVIALVGEHDEYERTAELAERHVLPLLAAHGVMTVQVARAGDSAGEGYRVLEATRTPTRLRREVTTWSFYEFLLRNGILPNVINRACSDKAKHFALDRFTADLTQGRPYLDMIGFELDETARAERDLARATALRTPWHPLRDWLMDRRACLDYLASVTGVAEYCRSCCSFCPYQYTVRGLDALMGRWSQEPAAAARALYLEYVALCMHPKMMLFKDLSAIALAREHGLHGALGGLAEKLADASWRVYDVRRVYPVKPGTAGEKGKALRSVRALTAPGSREQAAADLAELAAAEGVDVEVDPFDISRAVLAPQREVYPSVSRSYVLCPAVVADKQRDRFETVYGQLSPDGGGLSLLAEACA